MKTVSGHLHSITLIAGSPETIQVSYGIVENTYRPYSALFAFGSGCIVTVNGTAVSRVGDLFDWISKPRNITVTLNLDPQHYGLSKTTDFSDTQ